MSHLMWICTVCKFHYLQFKSYMSVFFNFLAGFLLLGQHDNSVGLYRWYPAKGKFFKIMYLFIQL